MRNWHFEDWLLLIFGVVFVGLLGLLLYGLATGVPRHEAVERQHPGLACLKGSSDEPVLCFGRADGAQYICFNSSRGNATFCIKADGMPSERP